MHVVDKKLHYGESKGAQVDYDTEKAACAFARFEGQEYYLNAISLRQNIQIRSLRKYYC